MTLTFRVARVSKFRGNFMTNKTDLFLGALTIQKWGELPKKISLEATDHLQ